jgi:hypothetical protein
LSYGAPVWEEAVTKQRNLLKPQRQQRLINTKFVKAYRTICFEVSCLMPGVPPIGIVIEGKTCLYKRKHSTGRSDYECDMPLPVTEWAHPARRVTIMETTDSTSYTTEIYKNGSKIGGKVGAEVAIYTVKILERQWK